MSCPFGYSFHTTCRFAGPFATNCHAERETTGYEPERDKRERQATSQYRETMGYEPREIETTDYEPFEMSNADAHCRSHREGAACSLQASEGRGCKCGNQQSMLA